MSSQGTKSSKPRTPTSQWQGSPKFSSSSNANSSSSYFPISSHMAMMEFKQNIIASLSKLADRDTYEIAVSDLEYTIQTISQDAIPMLLNCLFDFSNHSKSAVKKESIRLLALVCTTKRDLMLNHLTKIITHICRRLKDSDSGVRDACRDSVGVLSSQYINNESVVGLFAKPLFEAMKEHRKNVQAGAAVCMAEMVDSAAEPQIVAFQKLCLKICKLLNNPNFLGKAALLTVVSSLSQVGAIAPQSFPSLLQGIQECLRSPDWATRKAAAEALTTLLLHSPNLITDEDASTLTVLEGCRFDKVKLVRDSVIEALQLWKKIFGKLDEGPDDLKSSSQESENQDLEEMSENIDMDPGDLLSKAKWGTAMDKAVSILKKKAPALIDKELNPDFFEKHETWGSGDLPIEVLVPRICDSPTNSNDEKHSRPNARQRSYRSRQHNEVKKWRLRAFDEENFEDDERELISIHAVKSNSHSGNLVTIQRQLLQLERQQMQFMDMLQDFMGDSKSKMIAIENRLRGVEMAVTDMVRDLSISSPGRVGGLTTDGYKGKYNDHYYCGTGPSMRGRNMQWGSDSRSPRYNNISNNNWSNGKTTSLRKAISMYLINGEGPSARSVWQASKDEATLEAIRVVGGGDMEVGGNAIWGNAMDALEVGDTNASYAQVLSTEDDVLLVKLMERSGPVVDQLSSDVAADVLHAVARLMMVDENILEICLCWIHQLVEIMLEKGGNCLEIPDEVKKEIVLNLHQICSSARDDSEGVVPDHLLIHLASAWHINLPHDYPSL